MLKAIKTLLVLFPVLTFASLNLDFQLVYKKSLLDEKAFLKSEIQEALDFSYSDTVNLSHQNLKIEVNSKPYSNPYGDEHGPSELVITKVKVHKVTEKEKVLLADSQVITALEKEGHLEIVGEDFGQLDIKLKAHF